MKFGWIDSNIPSVSIIDFIFFPHGFLSSVFLLSVKELGWLDAIACANNEVAIVTTAFAAIFSGGGRLDGSLSPFANSFNEGNGKDGNGGIGIGKDSLEGNMPIVDCKSE